MDIDIKCDEGRFKLRSCGVIVSGDYMLVDKARNFDGFVYLGGHVALGENSKDTIIRESREELQVEVEIEKLICINENIYPILNGESVAHEVAFYYLLKPTTELPLQDITTTEVDNGVEITHHYSWVKLTEAREKNVRPSWLAEMILTGTENYYHLSDQTEKL